MERQIVDVSFESPPIGGAKPGDKIFGDLVDLLKRWRLYLATRENLSVDPEQFRLEAELVIRLYPSITLADIEWMMDLYHRGVLPMNYPPNWVTFNADFLCRVANAYKLYKDQKSAELIQRVDPARLYQNERAVLIAEQMQVMIKEVARQIEAGVLIVKRLKEVYDYCQRMGLLDTTTENSPAALEFAKAKIEVLQKSRYTGNGSIGPFQYSVEHTRELLKQYQREFALLRLFNTQDLGFLLENVKPQYVY